MTAESLPRPPRRGRARLPRVVMVVGAVLGLILALLVIAYAARREAARQILTDWLEERGVEAQVEFQELDLDGLVASLRAGPADDPDLVVERVEVDYALGAPWGGFSVTPSRIRVVRPQVKATLRGGEISFGSLDPVIDEFLDRPPSDEEGGPLILIEAMSARLITRGGDLRATGDARLDDGRLVSADLAMPAARLRDEAIDLDLTSGRLTARTQGDRLTLSGAADVQAIRSAGLTGRDADLVFSLSSPYPDTRLRRADGPVRATVELDAGRAGWEGGGAEALSADLTFDGRAQGWLDVFSLEGRLDGAAGAGALTSGDLSLSRVSADLDGDRFRIGRGEEVSWRYDGDARLAAGGLRRGNISAEGLVVALSNAVAGGGSGGTELTADAGLSAARFSQDKLSLLGVSGAFDLDATFTGATLVTLLGSMRSRGGSWPILGAPTAGDIPEQAVLKRAFGAFSLDAPGLTLRTGSPGTTLFLTRPARITPASGGQVVIGTRAGQPLYSARPGESGGGAFALTASGGGLPEAQVQVVRYDMGEGITARIEGGAELDFGLARDIALTTAGRLEIGGGRTDYFATGCTPFTAALLELGENDVQNLSASLCPPDGPMLSIADGWRFRSQAREVRAEAPFLSMGVTEGAGLITAGDTGSGLTATAQVSDVVIYDTEEPTRFNPMRGSGRVTLANETWNGVFALADRRHGAHVADLTITHDGRSGIGGLEIDATGVTFAAEGLQPADLSPFAERVAQAEAVGVVNFTGGFRWTPETSTSSGLLSTQGLDFVSPAGPVTRLAGQVEFISLAPLLTAPAQRLRVERIDAFLPLLSAEVEFELNADRLRLADGRVETAGGAVSIEPLEIPLDASQAYEGVLVLDNVQLGELISRSGFADKVSLDAVVSGRLPFVMGPDGITFINGQITATQPGRLSIGRAALTGLEAEGGGEAVPPNAVQDFAYQAMENLSFDVLEATINSLPEGRLGVLFTIRGRHDPPQLQEIRLTLSELIQRDFMNRQLPLPSGTEINLTLDTSLNLDQFIADLMELQRARNAGRRSETVQPQGR